MHYSAHQHNDTHVHTSALTCTIKFMLKLHLPNETLIFTMNTLVLCTKDASIQQCKRKIQITKPNPECVQSCVCVCELCVCREHLAQADGCKFNARRNIYYWSTQDFNVQWYMFICSSVFLLLRLLLFLSHTLHPASAWLTKCLQSVWMSVRRRTNASMWVCDNRL